jgi:GNAT superfamily N-acetyltransferase
MSITIHEITSSELEEYESISIAYEVLTVLQPRQIDGGLGGIRLVEEPVAEPYVKDYDSYKDGAPRRWLQRFDTRNWGFLVARDEGQTVGAATLAFDTPGVLAGEGRRDLTVLWDIRVQLGMRRGGIGRILFDHAVEWTRKKGCKRMKIESQNVNVPACRFYVKQGCELGNIDCYGYVGSPQVAHEVMLVWYHDL